MVAAGDWGASVSSRNQKLEQHGSVNMHHPTSRPHNNRDADHKDMYIEMVAVRTTTNNAVIITVRKVMRELELHLRGSTFWRTCNRPAVSRIPA